MKIDWGRAGNLPAQIWGFFQLKHFPVGSIQQLPELDFAEVYKGTFAIIENADYMEEGAEAGEEGLFREACLEAKLKAPDGTVLARKFYLVDVECFKEALVVIPNLGTKDRYLEMTARAKWADQCIAWIKANHEVIPVAPVPVAPVQEVDDNNDEEEDEEDENDEDDNSEDEEEEEEEDNDDDDNENDDDVEEEDDDGEDDTRGRRRGRTRSKMNYY